MPVFFAVTPVWSSAIIALAMATSAVQEQAERPDYQKPLPPVSERLKGPATEFANLSPADCRQRLKEADEQGAFKRQGPASGVATPLRIVGPLDDVEFRVPPASSKYGVLDCRLALLLLELAPLLSENNVASVRIDNFHRPGARIRRGRRSQHSYALAADIVSITLKDGTVLDVQDDFAGKVGEPPCGEKANLHFPRSADAQQVARATHMRNLVCQWARGGWFHHTLTPNFNRAHRDHLHLDIQRDNKWFSVD